MDVPLVEFVGKAEKLIERLRPTMERWAPNPGDWIFRGQRDSRWGLLPAAFRPSAWPPFANPGEAPFNPAAAAGTIAQEWNVLRRFLEGLDRSGLDVPNDILVRPHLDDGAHSFLRFPLYPAPLVFVALAAHHNIPTRLLDWSRVALNAAYFAAAGAAKHSVVARFALCSHVQCITWLTKLTKPSCLLWVPRSAPAFLVGLATIGQFGVFVLVTGFDPCPRSLPGDARAFDSARLHRPDLAERLGLGYFRAP